MSFKTSWRAIGLAIALSTSAIMSAAHATPCGGGFINPITKISWECVFPIQIAGVKIFDNKDPDLDRDNPSGPICICPSPTIGIPTPGLRVNFWNPANWVDTTEEPGCLKAIGIDVMSTGFRLAGTRKDHSAGGTLTFAQSHYYRAPVWALLDLFTDIPCLRNEGFDIAMMSEINPLYQNEQLALFAYPETILFANPAAVLACIADSVLASEKKRPIDEMFWCMGGWGTTYPLGGNSSSNTRIGANANIAAKQIFMMGRLGLLQNSTRDGCGEAPAPIWKKSLYKMQQMTPVKQQGCVNIGQSDTLWGAGLNNPTDTNHSWAIFEKKYCCVNP